MEGMGHITILIYLKFEPLSASNVTTHPLLADGLRRHLRTHTGEKVIQMQPVRLCFLSYKRLEEIF